MWCWHRWKIMAKDILPSMIEQLAGLNVEMKGQSVSSYKPCIVHYRCEKCGSEKVERI